MISINVTFTVAVGNICHLTVEVRFPLQQQFIGDLNEINVCELSQTTV